MGNRNMRTLLRWILLSAEIGCVCLTPAAPTCAAGAEPVPTHAFENNWGLVQPDNKLNVDDPVAKYLPEFKDQMVGAKQPDSAVGQRTISHPLLIRELLSHMSGFTNTLRHDETLPLEQ